MSYSTWHINYPTLFSAKKRWRALKKPTVPRRLEDILHQLTELLWTTDRSTDVHLCPKNREIDPANLAELNRKTKQKPMAGKFQPWSNQCVCVCVCCSYRFPIKNWCVFQPVMLVFFWGGGYGSSNAVTQLGWHVEIMWKSKSSKSDQLCAPFHLLAKLNHHTERTEFDLGYHNKFWCCLGNCY